MRDALFFLDGRLRFACAFQQTNRFFFELVAVLLVLTHLILSSTSSTLRGDFSAVYYSGSWHPLGMNYRTRASFKRILSLPLLRSSRPASAGRMWAWARLKFTCSNNSIGSTGWSYGDVYLAAKFRSNVRALAQKMLS